MSGEVSSGAPTVEGPWAPAVGAVNRVSLLACELLLVVMMLVIMAEVVARSFFSVSLQFVDEYGSYCLVWLTFLSLSVALHDNALFRVVIVFDLLPARVKAALLVLWDLCSLVYIAIAAWQCFRQVVSTYEREMVSATVIATPLWIPQIVMPVGSVLVLLVLLAVTATDIARLRQVSR